MFKKKNVYRINAQNGNMKHVILCGKFASVTLILFVWKIFLSFSFYLTFSYVFLGMNCTQWILLSFDIICLTAWYAFSLFFLFLFFCHSFRHLRKLLSNILFFFFFPFQEYIYIYIHMYIYVHKYIHILLLFRLTAFVMYRMRRFGKLLKKIQYVTTNSHMCYIINGNLFFFQFRIKSTCFYLYSKKVHIENAFVVQSY